MIRKFLPFVLFLITLSVQAQKYTTPDTGVNWTMDSLVLYNPATISFLDDAYIITGDVELSETDTLILRPGDIVKIDSAITITVSGTFLSRGQLDNPVVITAVDSIKPYRGFRFEEEALVIFDYSIVKNGGGLKIISPNLTITNCAFLNNTSGIATAAVIDLSYGSPLIQNNKFIHNAKPAIGSPANREVSAKILDNYFEGNNQLNENRPQLNMGTTGKDTLVIKGNTIIGDRSRDRVGAIAVSNLLGSPDGVTTVIENNIITDNRYGITIAGNNAFALIKNNIIEDNNSENKPLLGGSGISLNAGSLSQNITITGNEIRRNLWGITMIGQATANIGNDTIPGNNIFADNGNEGVVYALYNNTPNKLLAKGNCWIEGAESTYEEVAAVIFDQADDSSLGEVLFDPFLCGETVNTIDLEDNFSFYPNPAHDRVYLPAQHEVKQIAIYNTDGREMLRKEVGSYTNYITFDLNPGLYIVEFDNGNKKVNQKLIVQ